MAKRMKSKIQPAVMKLNFDISSDSGDFQEYLDLSQVASLVNRRFYRQGLLWGVAGIKVQQRSSSFIGPSQADPTISISKLPHTWVMSNAWEKSFRAWMQMNKEALAEAPTVKPKFLDYKIYADTRHHAKGFATNLLPVDSDGNVATPGEWTSSKLRIPVGVAAPGDTTEREIMAVGPNYPGGAAVVSIIDGYAASRALPDIADPNTPQDADNATGLVPENWLSALQSEGTEQDSAVLADLISENTVAPYPFENDPAGNVDTMYPGGANQLPGMEIHDRAIVTNTTIGGTSYFSGGSFPCGLIKFEFENFSASAEAPVSFYLEITLAPGSHRGYLAEPMTEM